MAISNRQPNLTMPNERGDEIDGDGDDNAKPNTARRVRQTDQRIFAELIPAPGNLIIDSIYKQFIIITAAEKKKRTKNGDRKIVL